MKEITIIEGTDMIKAGSLEDAAQIHPSARVLVMDDDEITAYIPARFTSPELYTQDPLLMELPPGDAAKLCAEVLESGLKPFSNHARFRAITIDICDRYGLIQRDAWA